MKLLPLLLLLLLPAVVQAQFTFTTNDGTITITGYTGPGGAVTIPGTINGYPVTSIGDDAFFRCYSLTSATIPNSVTTIGYYAFYSCSSLTNVTIPNSVTTIGYYAFDSCSSLTNVTIPKSVTTIEDGAFARCARLTAITVDALNPVFRSVAGVLFNHDQSVLIQCPGGKAGGYTISNSVITIGDGAFGDCYSLTNVTIPNSVITIGSGAFTYCTNLTSVTIPNSVTNIGDFAFGVCNSLASIMVDTNNPSYSSVAGVLFDKSQTALIEYPGGLSGSYTIPNSVTTIGYAAFFDCYSLTSVTIPNSVTSIGDQAFFHCYSLTSATIPNSVTTIGSAAFYFCSSLTNVTIGTKVANIGDRAFAHCARLTAITVDALNPIFSSVAGVLFNHDQSVLIQCPGGKAGGYTISNSVITIGDEAFGDCYSLTNVTIPSSVTTIGSGAFSYCTNLTSVAIPNNVTTIGDFAFFVCKSLASIMVDTNNPSYSSVAGVLFDKSQTALIEYPGGLSGSYTIPNSVTTIGDGAFAACASLTSVTIGNSVTNIGFDAFGFCSSLTGVYFTGNSPTPTNDLSVFSSDIKATVYYLPGTIGWGSMFDGRPTAIWQPQVQTVGAGFGVQTNQFGFNINWASGQTVVVEACTNLFSPDWQPVQTNTLTTGAAYFSDPQWTNYPGRFYRLRSP